MRAGIMWSKGAGVTKAEGRELHAAMDRHDGLFFLAAAAGFALDHKAQGDRLDFGRLFKAYRDQFPVLIGGRDEDPFEKRQVEPPRERLRKLRPLGKRVARSALPPKHQPQHLAPF